MRLIWTTDIHLNHVPASVRERWLQRITAQDGDALLISGDIAESGDVVSCLHWIAEATGIPVYFVLGNHDFYGGSIGATVRDVIRACRDVDHLHYLTDIQAIPLTGSGPQDRTYLIGEDGWGDATEGDFDRSYVRLNDFVQIQDFAHADCNVWKEMLQHLGAVSSERLTAKLLAVPEDARQVVIVTHVPPFREACWYEGRTTDDDWAPFFVCGQLGRALRSISQTRPQCHYTVLCGHTHHDGVAQIEPNLTIYTGGACYGQPEIAAIVKVAAHSIVIQEARENAPEA